MTTPPLGPGVSGGSPLGAAPFVVTAPPDLKLAADRTGVTSFTITNLTGRPVRARLKPRGQAGAADSWFTVPPEQQEIPLPIAATVVVNVSVVVPADAPEGQRQMQLEVSAEDDTEQVTGQTVVFAVPAPVAVAKRRIPWLVIAIVAAVLLLGGGLTAFLLLRDKAPENTALPVVSGEPVVGSVITGSDGSWDAKSFGLNYQWLACDDAGGQCAAIDGARSADYTLVTADVGKTVRMEITASNSKGETIARSEPLGPIKAAAAERVPAPLLINLRFVDAARVAKQAGFGISATNPGVGKCAIVRDQKPEPGAPTTPGIVIRVVLQAVIISC